MSDETIRNALDNATRAVYHCAGDKDEEVALRAILAFLNSIPNIFLLKPEEVELTDGGNPDLPKFEVKIGAQHAYWTPSLMAMTIRRLSAAQSK